MMKFAWAGYTEYAWGHDELKPVSRTARDWLGASGLAASIVDALDTLWIMGLEKEYEEAARFVRDELTFDKDVSVSFFETVIRDLGGLLAAYALTGDRAFVAKADDLGERLVPAFRTTTGMPAGVINLGNGHNGAQPWSGGSFILAEVGTFQLEFRYLTHVTGKRKYAELADATTSYLFSQRPHIPGLYPNRIPMEGGLGHDEEYSFGGLGDSFYEYLLKQWLFTNRTEDRFRKAYEDSITVRGTRACRAVAGHRACPPGLTTGRSGGPRGTRGHGAGVALAALAVLQDPHDSAVGGPGPAAHVRRHVPHGLRRAVHGALGASARASARDCALSLTGRPSDTVHASREPRSGLLCRRPVCLGSSRPTGREHRERGI